MSMEGQAPGQLPAGWYYAEGDAPGTKRYWDGSQWTSEPQVMTGEAGTRQDVEVHASGGRRLGGRIIDVIIAGIIGAILGGVAGSGPDQQAFADSIEAENMDLELLVPSAGGLLIGALFAFLWDFLFTAFAGGTPGKLILGMRVAEADGMASPPSMAVAGKRALNRLLGLLGFIGFAGLGLGWALGTVIGLVSLVFLFSDDARRTVMDRIAGSVVVMKDAVPGL